MKTIKKLKLFELEKNEMSRNESKQILGGHNPGDCECGCPGYDNVQANTVANYSYGYSESGGDVHNCYCDGGGMSEADVKA